MAGQKEIVAIAPIRVVRVGFLARRHVSNSIPWFAIFTGVSSADYYKAVSLPIPPKRQVNKKGCSEGGFVGVCAREHVKELLKAVILSLIQAFYL